MKLKLRTLLYLPMVMELYEDMIQMANALMDEEVCGWVNEYALTRGVQYGVLGDDYTTFVHSKRGKICERVSDMFKHNQLGMYIYNDENNHINFAYYDGEMKDRGTVNQKTYLKYSY